MGLDYYDVSIFDTLPGLYQEVAAAFKERIRPHVDLSEMPLLLSFGSWIGGDRDGNPFVTPEVTREAIRDGKRVLSYYDQRLQLLIDLLTTSAQQAPISEELRTRLEGYLNQLPIGGTQVFGEHFEFELYRRFLSACMRACFARRSARYR